MTPMNFLLFREPPCPAPERGRLPSADAGELFTDPEPPPGVEVKVFHSDQDFLRAAGEDEEALLLIDFRCTGPVAPLLYRSLAVEDPVEGRLLAVLGRDGVPESLPDPPPDDLLFAPLPAAELMLRHRLLLGRRADQATRQEARKLAEERFKRLVELSPDTVALHADGEWVFVNSAGLELFGAESAEEIVGHSMFDFVAPEHHDQVRDRVYRLHNTNRPVPVVEQRMLRLDGDSIDVEVVAVPANFRGRPATQVILRDITARKRTEAALRHSEKRFRDLFEGVPAGVYRIRPNGCFAALNRHLSTLLGYNDPTELEGFQTGTLYADPADRKRWRRIMQKEGRVENFETQVRRADGTLVWVRSTAQAIYRRDGELEGYEGTVEDISEQRKAEEALRAREERFRSLVQNASDLISILDSEARVRYHSPSLERLLGFELPEREGHYAFERVHPEDRPELEERFRELLETPGQSVRTEFRIRNRPGNWRVLESIFTNHLEEPAVGGVVVNSRDVTERKAAEDRLVHDALHDALTGLPNRVLFMDRLSLALEHGPRRPTYRCAVLFLDLDRFKMINDSFGHAAGDQLLVQASKRLRRCLRPSDTLARLGGDEFAVLLDDVGDAGNAVRVANRIQEEVGKPLYLEGREIYSSTSIGIALSTGKGQGAEELLRDADTAMYRAKSRGRAGFAIFDAAMHAQVKSQLQLETDFHRAVELGQMEMFYQPIVSLASGHTQGFEALLRWRHPSRGLVLPEQFLGLAEETGLIHTLGQKALMEACQAARTFSMGLSGEPLTVSVNLSSRQLTQGDLPEQVQKALQEADLPGSALCLELGESATLEHPEEALLTLQSLKNLGVKLSLDRFGSGHSSLSVLHRFPFDQVKIDRWFVQELGSPQGGDDLLEGILALCHWRRLETVATGVETESQRRTLALMGCTSAQGFLFSAPMPLAEVQGLLENTPAPTPSSNS